MEMCLELETFPFSSDIVGKIVSVFLQKFSKNLASNFVSTHNSRKSIVVLRNQFVSSVTLLTYFLYYTWNIFQIKCSGGHKIDADILPFGHT